MNTIPTVKGSFSLKLGAPTSKQEAFSIPWLLASAVACVLCWLLIKRLGAASEIATTGVMVLLIGVATALLATYRIALGLAVVGYLAVLEPLFKAETVFVPYLTLQYSTLMWAVLLFAVVGRLPRPRWPLLFYGAYVFLEIAGLGNNASFELGRALLMPSLALLLFMSIALQIRLTRQDLTQITIGLLLGGLSMGAVIGYSYLTGAVFETMWTTESNRMTSGGLGPVQVSFVLSAVAFLVLWLSGQVAGTRRWLLVGFVCLLGFLMIMTFSRGGLYLLAGAAIVYVVSRGDMNWGLLLGAAAVVVGGYFLFQFGSDLTGGALIERYESLSSTNRAELVRHGWDIFRHNPFFGVGTGGYHLAVEEYVGKEAGAHNEFIRSAAEHGIFGITLWVLFAGSGAWLAFTGARREVAALRLALFALFIASTFHNGLKLLMQPLLVMLALSFVGNPKVRVRALFRRVRDRPTRTTEEDRKPIDETARPSSGADTSRPRDTRSSE